MEDGNPNMKNTKTTTMDSTVLQSNWPRIMAHRGACTLAPENTLSAFKKARELGCKGVELDVHLCKSGELVVTHDHWLDRIAGVHRRIETLSYDEISELDAGSHFNRKFPDLAEKIFSQERIPLFEHVLETLGPEIFIDVEIKLDTFCPRPLVESVAKMLKRHNRTNCIVSSFNPLALRAYRFFGAHATAAIYCQDKSVPFFLRHKECLYLSNADIKKPALEIALKGAGFETGTKPVIVWTADDKKTIDTLFSAGVSSVITNRIQDFLNQS